MRVGVGHADVAHQNGDITTRGQLSSPNGVVDIRGEAYSVARHLVNSQGLLDNTFEQGAFGCFDVLEGQIATVNPHVRGDGIVG